MKVQLLLIACFVATVAGQFGGNKSSRRSSRRTSSPTSPTSPSTTPRSTAAFSSPSPSTSRFAPSSAPVAPSSMPSAYMRNSVTSPSNGRFFSVSASTSKRIPLSNYSTSSLILPLASGTGGKDPTGRNVAIVVGVVGGAILIAAVISFVLWMTRRQRHQESKPVAATVANDYEYGEFTRPVQRLPSEHQYAIIDETDTGSVNGSFTTPQYEYVTSTSETNNQISGISNEAMTSAKDAPIDNPDSRGSISEVTLVENTFYG